MKKISYLSLCIILACASRFSVAENHTQPNQKGHLELEPIVIHGESEHRQGAPLGGRLAASERVIHAYHLKQQASNIGDALANEVGIHASQFGGGASAPVIRGQEGKRIKILTSGSETLDMSSMSPDHAVTVDSLLAKQVEILRGANTLLYSSGNAAGVVNVVDNSIPTAAVAGVQGEIGLRTNTGDKERLMNVALDVGLGEQVVAHAEGIFKKAGDYRTPSYSHQGQTHHRLANSFVDNKSGSLGLSWVGEKGYLGVAYSERKDKYGLPAHSHLYDDYYLHVLLSDAHWRKPYLQHYPFLMEETDIDYNNPGIDCIKKEWHSHGNLCNHGHGHGHGHQGEQANHTDHADPHIALKTQRWTLRGEWKTPVTGLEKLRFSVAKVDYRHDEKSGAISDNAFKNRGYAARVEVLHQPILGLTGLVGVSHTTQDSYALDNHTLDYRRQNLLSDHRVYQQSVFFLERADIGKWQLDVGGRVERQKIAMKYAFDVPADEKPSADLMRPHKSKAYSYAFSANYQATAQHQFNLIFSHQERLPNAQELYAHGKHLATNAFEVGNKNLKKEKSNNIELGWDYSGEKLGVKVSGYYQQFSNYIYAAILNDKTCAWRRNGRCTRSLSDAYPLRLYRYNQAKANIYGLEAEATYHISAHYDVALFGDYVRGKLKDLPSLPTGYTQEYDAQDNVIGVKPLGWEKQPDGNAPRMSPMRLGVKFNAHFDNGVSLNSQLYRVFKQTKVARLESPTKGHTMFNAGISYEGKMGRNEYTLFANVHNVLNTKVYNHTSFLSYLPQQGRHLSVGMNVKF